MPANGESVPAPARRSLPLLACPALLLAAAAAYSLTPYSGGLPPAGFAARYGPWAVVAGASEGLGAAWAEHLAARGVHLVLIARSRAKLDAVSAALRRDHDVTIETVVADLGADGLAGVLEGATRGRDVGLLVYNAAFDNAGPFLKRSLESHLKADAVNVRGPLVSAHVVGRALAARPAGGGIVLMSSMAGTVGSAHIANYAATKAWNTVFSHGLWNELRGDGIDVSACVAGATSTPNFLKAASATRNTAIEQTAEEVVDECAAALAAGAPSVATGALNKAVRAIFSALPTKLAVKIFTDGTEQTMSADTRQ